jgi:AcrR family transcriptional regulator
MAKPTTKGYASEDMEVRRVRILVEARKLIELGEKKMTIAKLSECADVAPRTIYRAFEDRDGVILAVIREHMQAISEFLSKSPIEGDIDSVMREYDWIVAELFRGAEFARVLISFYFSPRPGDTTIKELRSVAMRRMNAFLGHADRRRLRNLRLDRALLAQRMVDDEYLILTKWAIGRIEDRQVGNELKASFLANAMIASEGELQAEALNCLALLHENLAD